MEKSFYFMAGLPRSGSTVLSAILNQNPRLYSGPSSPVVSSMIALEQHLSNDELFMAYPKSEQAATIIANILPQYYLDIEKPVIIDKNRSWVNRPHYISGYFGIEPKIICPVRSIEEILTSFISMHKRNPYEVNGKINFIDDMLVRTNTPLTDENRCMFLGSDNGILGQSYNALKQLVVEGRESILCFIEYDDLIQKPQETMQKIYDFLDEEPFEHDFEKLENQNQENDAAIYGIEDMHSVRKKLEKTSPSPDKILPESILNQCQGLEFWRELKLPDLSGERVNLIGA